MDATTVDRNIVDKSIRSVFVGNIPYEMTEDKLKEIFSQAGQVLSFKLVFDRETGKPKGYGFCEYQDQETALCAMRNLNNYEIGGRFLRVDNACTEKSRMEMQNLMMKTKVESPYGESIDPEKAPEAISKVIASLPPEQLLEVMKQMKECLRDNPVQAKKMLEDNPQLAYALLQAQVAMKIVAPETASTMLYEPRPFQTLTPSGNNITGPVSINTIYTPKPIAVSQPERNNFTDMPLNMNQMPGFSGQGVNNRSVSRNFFESSNPSKFNSPRNNMNNTQNVGMLPPSPKAHFTVVHSNSKSTDGFVHEPRPKMIASRKNFRQNAQNRRQYKSGPSPKCSVKLPSQPIVIEQPDTIPHFSAENLPNVAALATTDQEKAGLIMQVLQLSDEQIMMLPPEQRKSIVNLKAQIIQSTVQI